MRIFPIGGEASEGKSNRAQRENGQSIVYDIVVKVGSLYVSGNLPTYVTPPAPETTKSGIIDVQV